MRLKIMIFLKKLCLSFAIALCPLVIIIYRSFSRTLLLYELVSDVYICLSWIFSAILLRMEYVTGNPSNWVLRSWWVAAFMLGSFRLQELIALDNFGFEFFWYVPWFALYTTIAFLGLWFNKVPPLQHGMSLLIEDEQVAMLDIIEGGESNASEEVPQKRYAKSPETEAGVWNFLIFAWLNPLLKLGSQQTLTHDDLYPLPPSDKPSVVANALSSAWKSSLESAKQRGKTASLLKTLITVYGKRFALSGILKLIHDILLFMGPVLLKQMVTFIETPEQPFYYGILFTAGMFVAPLLQSLAINRYFLNLFRLGMQCKVALISLVYRKSFCQSVGARGESTVGEIVNLQAIDVEKVQALFPYLHVTWSAPLQIIIAIAMLVRIIGWAATAAGTGVLIVLLPLNALISRKLTSITKEVMKLKDKRGKVINEVLSGMRVIKFFAWEDSFVEQISVIRKSELEMLRSSLILQLSLIQEILTHQSLAFFFYGITPPLVSTASFMTFSLTGHELTATIAFTSLSVFNILRFPMGMLPNVLINLAEARVSLGRLQRYLLSEELDPDAVHRTCPANPDIPYAVKISDGTFSWGGDTIEPVLRNINLEIPRGKLVAIVGEVGCGKSTLLGAILGDTLKLEGQVSVNGTFAYVAQQPWIMNASLIDNVTFGADYNPDKYQETILTTELLPDIEILPNGDQTEIGEKGINLSGGQRQRIATARAVYASADIYLLDDPLASVDANVGRAIFEKCIQEQLVGTTRILVTHQLQFLPYVDEIIVLKDGCIAEQGSYRELMDAELAFAALINAHVGEDQISKQKKSSGCKPDTNEKSNEKKLSLNKGALITKEVSKTGAIPWKTYYRYALAMGGIIFVGVILLFYFGDQGSKVAGDWWLSLWADEILGQRTLWFYLGFYLLFETGNITFKFIHDILRAFAGLFSARKLHNNMLSSIVRSPMSFFDTTPIGRILNRFTKDINTIDINLPRSLGSLTSTLFSLSAIAVVIGSVTPFFLVAILPLVYVYKYIRDYFLSSSRELNRLDSVSKSPIFALFQETLCGLSTIRAYAAVPRFCEKNKQQINTNQEAYWAAAAGNRWLGTRLEFLGTCVVTVASFFALIQRNTIDAGAVGLSLSYALNTTGLLNWVVRMSNDVETQFVSVERVVEYGELQPEAPGLIPERRPHHTWPQSGAILMKDVKLRYRKELDLVLQGVSVSINPGEKVGVCGRTGAGKSSLMLALFRLVEPEYGQIFIDDVDISTIGLTDLRSRLAIIPQDPILFTGTIRSNLDPFNEHNDTQIIESLRSVHLDEFVDSLPEQIEAPVHENGENLSVGQRQLLCLARAILRRPQILVMDEATAAVDFETDAFIQQTVRKEFEKSTVLTIAHRINTIIDYDRIMVLDKGVLVEYDSPAALLSKQDSIFNSMVTQNSSANNMSKEPESE